MNDKMPHRGEESSNVGNPTDSLNSLASEDQYYKSSRKSTVGDADSEPSQVERTRLALKAIVDSVFRRQLPLQDETSYFILANVLDFIMTFLLLREGAIETNPFADFFYKNWGFQGMLYFKLLSVAFICVLAQVIANRSMRYAKFVLIGGTVIVGFVVAYSARLFYSHF